MCLFLCVRTDLSVQLEVQGVGHAFCLTACTETLEQVAIETDILSQHKKKLVTKVLLTIMENFHYQIYCVCLWLLDSY